MLDYFKERSKAFAAGLAGALTMAVIKQAEIAFGFDLDTTTETLLVSAVAGAVNGIAVYWAPANKPKE